MKAESDESTGASAASAKCAISKAEWREQVMAQFAKVRLRCNFCGTVFMRAIRSAYMEIRCPKCREYDIDVIG